MKKVFVLTAFLLLMGVTVYAANGDLVVNGDLCVGGKCTSTITSVPVWDYTVTGSAVTFVTSPTLDGNVHGGYEFEFYIENSTAGTVLYYLYVNNDQVTNNYEVAGAAANIGVGLYLEGHNTATLFPIGGVASNHRIRHVGTITISPNGYVTTSYHGVYRTPAGTGGIAGSFSHWKLAAVTNLTRIDIVSSVANGIGINSMFRLWRRK